MIVVNTHAYITGSSSIIYANDSILVSAVDDLFGLIILGKANGSGTVAVGGEVEISTIVKHVTAYVDDDVTLDALANGDGLTAPTGSFNVSWTDKPNAEFDPGAIVGDIITLNEHGYQTGDQVVYNNSFEDEQQESESDEDYQNRLNEASVGGLNTGQAYYIIWESDNSFRLAETYEDAMAGNAIALTGSVAVGDTHRIEIAYGITVTPSNIDPSTDVSGDVITMNDHGFVTGDPVTYSNGGGDSIGGLEDGGTYYVIRLTDNTFQLATQKTNAEYDVAIALDASLATGTEHMIWDGVVNDPSSSYQIPGISSTSGNFNNDDDPDTDMDSGTQDDFNNALLSERTTQSSFYNDLWFGNHSH